MNRHSREQDERLEAKSRANVTHEARAFFTSALIAAVPTTALLWAATLLFG
ncbi:MAG: hypothetical protein JRI23_29215 [Deltaproteobacteria bacterium]|jgi:hypothetical protein|nr:hypothetical protein [Deltaproteobacteria bacterium]MBW2536219.1 hypothetical protein [Deltaproteobacteria bacterium]